MNAQATPPSPPPSAARPAPASNAGSQETAPLATLSNRWPVPEDDFAHLQAGPVLCRLTDQSVLEFDGPDAMAFLQSQTTADLQAMSMQSWQLGGYCTPKGRLLAIFQAWRYETGLRMLLPSAIAPAVLRRLSMYVLRAKVRARDASAEWVALAVVGTRADQGGARALRHAGMTLPQSPWQACPLDGDGRVAAVPVGAQCAERWLCVVPAAHEGQWLQRLAPMPVAAPDLSWWAQIDAAIPAVFAQTSELFVPQTLNLEVLGGVNFRKGCYPGQEIVARSQYLGKLRRRLALAHARELGPGADIYVAGKDDPVGRIVMAASAPGGGWDLLFECAAELGAQAGTLRAGAPDAPLLEVRPLPYTIFDPTA